MHVTPSGEDEWAIEMEPTMKIELAQSTRSKVLRRTGAGFSMVAGQPCVIDGLCVTSPNCPGTYNMNELCEMSTLYAGIVTTIGTFNTESGCDKLRLEGVNYDGSTGPVDVSVSLLLNFMMIAL